VQRLQPCKAARNGRAERDLLSVMRETHHASDQGSGCAGRSQNPGKLRLLATQRVGKYGPIGMRDAVQAERQHDA